MSIVKELINMIYSYSQRTGYLPRYVALGEEEWAEFKADTLGYRDDDRPLVGVPIKRLRDL